MKPFNAALIADFKHNGDNFWSETIRKDKNIPFKDAIELMAINNDNVSTYFDSIVSKGNISSLQYVTEK
jgi:valyl-tRNA synthetase